MTLRIASSFINCSGSNWGTGSINYQKFYGLREKSEFDAKKKLMKFCERPKR